MLQELRNELAQLRTFNPGLEFHPALRRSNGTTEIRGRNEVDFTSWDFLNLNSSARIKRVAQMTIEARGLCAQASRLSSGSTEEHAIAEYRLAKFMGAESALLFSSRNQAILSLATALLQERDVVLADETSYGLVSDAASLMGATFAAFRAEDPSSLDIELEKYRFARRKLVFLETVSFLTGKRVDLPSILTVLRRHDAYVVLDESFAVAACGVRGAGVSEGLTCGPQVIGYLLDCSLGLAAQGCAIIGSKVISSYLMHRSRTFQLEVACPPAVAAAIEAAINIVEVKPIEREKLAIMTRKLTAGLSSIGLISVEDETPIVSISMDRLRTAQNFASALFQKGYLVDVFPRGKLLSDSAVIRLIVRAAHSDRQIEGLLHSCADIYSRIKGTA